MKTLFDLLPIVLFFGTYWLGGKDIYLATKVTIATTMLQLAVSKLVFKKIDMMLRISAGIVVVLGSLTLLLHNPDFIKWKPTIAYWGMAAGLFISNSFFKRNLMRTALEEQLKLPDKIWSRMNMAWVVFLAALGAINIVVLYTVSEAAWVNFKLICAIGIVPLFTIGLMMFVSRHLPKEPS